MEKLLKRKKNGKTSRRSKSVLEGWAIVRVSKENLATHGSPEQQLKTIKDWAKHQKNRTGKTYKITNFIVEDGVSGRYQNTHKRKDILYLAELVKLGTIDFIVAERLNRISRDEILNLQLMRDARENDVELHEVNYGKFDPQDRGQRMGWKFRNIQAGEYSEGVSEDVARKHRQAMINNGKDASPCPMIGLDSHPKWVGLYNPNQEELKIWEDIASKFVELDYSREGTLKYCKEKGYKTKIWWTKEKTKNGEIIKPEQKGGKNFDWFTLLNMLGNPKIRGYNYFYDNWNQFPQLQDKDGWVKWEYWHRREHGDLIDPELVKKVDEGLDRIEHRSRDNEFLLSGVVFAPDGSRYGGEAVRSGEFCYYRNRKNGKRFPANHLHELVLTRLRELLKVGVLEELIEKISKHQHFGLPKFKQERRDLEKEIVRLEKVVERFTESLRKNVVENTENLAEIIDLMIKEREKANSEIAALTLKLDELEQKEQQFKGNLKGDKLKRFIRLTLDNLDSMHPLEQKRLIKIIIPRITIHLGEKEHTLELFYNLDLDTHNLASSSHSRRGSLPLTLSSGENVISLFENPTYLSTESDKNSMPQDSRGLEDNNWPFIKNGRRDRI